MDKMVDGIIAPVSPYRDVADDEISQGYLSDQTSALSEIKAQTQESFIGRHFLGQNHDDIVQDFNSSWDSEKRRALAVSLGLYASDADLPARSGQPLLSPEEANARYSFAGADGKPVKIANEPVPDEVAREIASRKKEQTRRQGIMAHWEQAHSFDTMLGRMPTPYGFAVGLLTPDTVAMSVVPGVGEEALLARLGTGFAARTAAKGISGATTFAAGTGAIMAADEMLPDWRGERADLSLRQMTEELYSSAALGFIMHAAVNPAIGSAWRQAKQLALQRAGRGVEAGEASSSPSEGPTSGAPLAEPPASEKPIGDIAKALADEPEVRGPASSGETYTDMPFRHLKSGPTIEIGDHSSAAPAEPSAGGAWKVGDKVIIKDKDGVRVSANTDTLTDIREHEGTLYGQVEGSAGYYPLTWSEKVEHAEPAKPIGDLTEALAQFEGSDGPTKRAAMDTATGQILEGKPVEVRPHFDPATSEEVIGEQQRQDREGYAPGIDPATLAEETVKVYTPEEPEPGAFVKDMGGPIISPSETWAAKASERAKLAKDVELLEEGARRWSEAGVTSSFPQGPLLAQSLTRLRQLDRELAEGYGLEGQQPRTMFALPGEKSDGKPEGTGSGRAEAPGAREEVGTNPERTREVEVKPELPTIQAQRSPRLPARSPVPFKIPGYTGKIFRDEAGKDGLAGTYRFQVFARGKPEEPLATMNIFEREPGRWEVEWVENHGRKKGIATNLYDAVEAHLGRQIYPSGKLSDEGLAFWRKRDPELVRFHRPIEAGGDEGLNYSPRKVRERLDYLKDKRGYAAERKHLEKIWAELPDEAKTPYWLKEQFSSAPLKESPEVSSEAPAPEPAATEAAPPQWALDHAKDLAGRVVWQEGDLALVRGFSILSGQPVYAAAKEGVGRTRVDIAGYTGRDFTPAELENLKAARERAIASDAAEHQQNPDGPFAGKGNFAVSQSIPEKLAGYAKEMLRELGINARVYITTVEDAHGSDFHGPFAAIGSAGLDQNSNGTTRKLSNGDHYVALKIGSRQSKNIETLAHEVGHIFEKEEWGKAADGTKSAIMADYQEWLTKARSGNAEELIESLRAHTTGKTTTVLDPELPAAKLPLYWTSFGEWFADNVAKWAVSSEKPLSLAEKFFSRLASALRSFYTSLVGEKYLPAKSVKTWLDSRGPSEPLQGSMPGEPEAGGLEVQQSLASTPPRETSPAEQMEAFANQAMRYFISKAGPDINALLKPFARELDAFGRKTTSEDALAFFRSYFTQPSAAQSLAPGFARAIGQLFDRIDPDAHTSFVTRAKEYEAGIQNAAGNPSEIQGLSAETAQQLAKFENILQTFDTRALLPEELSELDQTSKDLAAAATPEEKEAAARRRADAIVNAIARKDRLADVQSTGQGARGAWLALASTLHGTWRGWRDSVEAQWRGQAEKWKAVPDNQIRMAGLNNLATKGLQDREVSRELWKLNAAQGKTGMPSAEGNPAQRLAEILWPAMRAAKDRMNEAGARIADALDYVLSTYHDPYKMRRAAGYTDGKWYQVGPLHQLASVDDAFRAWWKFVLPRLNHAKTFADLVPGEEQTIEEAREEFGRSVFNALITGVHMRVPGGEVAANESGPAYMAPAFEGTHNLARSLSQHRVLFWKDADSWFDYHQKFGPATTLADMVMRHLDSSARAVALMSQWGTNPAANLNLVIKKVQHEYRNSDPDGIVEFEKKTGNLRNVMAHLDGSANMPGNEMWANINRAYRSEYSASVLGATGLTHLVTLPWTVPSALKRSGIDRWESLTTLLGRLITDATGRGDDTRREVLSELGALPDSITRQIQRQFQPWGQDTPLNTLSGWASSAAANVMKYNGLNYFFDTAQTMARESVAAKMAANLGKDYAALDRWHRQMLGLYGFGEKEWKLLREVKPSEANGIEYLTPRDLHQISDAALDGYTKAKADEYRAKIEERRQKFEAADAREAEWHEARMENLNNKIGSLTDWISQKTATRDAAFKKRLLLKLAQVDEMRNHIETIQAATDLMQGLKGIGVKDQVQQFLEDVEGGAESWKAAQAAGRVIERGARSNLSAGERLGEQRAKIEARIKDTLDNLGGAEIDAKAKADVEWLDGRIAELRQGVEEANGRMQDRISARAERLLEMQEERLPELIEGLRRDTRNKLSDQLLSYYSETAHHAVIGSSVRERAMLLGSSRPGTLGGEVLRHALLYKMWPVAQFFQGLARDWYLSASNGERAMNLFYMMTLATFGGLMRMSINDLMRGNPQRDPTDPKTLLAGLAQGGGLGIYGDFLFGEMARNGANAIETLGGPLASDVAKLGHIYSNFYNSELDQTGRRKNTGAGDVAQWATSKIPLHNLIYLNAAMNYLLFYHLYEGLDPGWWDRMNRRLARERGRTAVGYLPGAGVPFGIPPIYMQTPSGHTEGLLAGR